MTAARDGSPLARAIRANASAPRALMHAAPEESKARGQAPRLEASDFEKECQVILARCAPAHGEDERQSPRRLLSQMMRGPGHKPPALYRSPSPAISAPRRL